MTREANSCGTTFQRLAAGGAEGLISLGLNAGLICRVVTPLAIEAEEIIRQVVPALAGCDDVSAGNTVGTVLWFLLFNLGVIMPVTPVAVPTRVRTLDGPFLVLAAAMSAAFLPRGRVGRFEGALLAGLGVIYAVVHIGSLRSRTRASPGRSSSPGRAIRDHQ